MFSVGHSGSFKNLDKFLDRMKNRSMYDALDTLARVGVSALSSQTPKDSGITAASWGYEVDISRDGATIFWTNHNTVNGFNVAIGLQYGHGTGTGGWVNGYDYINPAMRPIMDKIAEDVWKVVTNS